MKAICYISNFSKNLETSDVKELVTYVDKRNKLNNITGLLIIKNEYFFQILEGRKEGVSLLYKKIKTDHRHFGVIKLLDTKIEDRIFQDYNSGNFDIFQNFTGIKKLLKYFDWIKEANYLPANEIVNLTTSFLNNNK